MAFTRLHRAAVSPAKHLFKDEMQQDHARYWFIIIVVTFDGFAQVAFKLIDRRSVSKDALASRSRPVTTLWIRRDIKHKFVRMHALVVPAGR
jgi:hypothetical protein